MRPSSNAQVLTSPEPGGDDALLALEQQFEVLAREITVLSRMCAAQHGKGRRPHCTTGSANAGDPSERGRIAACAGNETDRDAVERCERLEAALARLEPIERAMMATPAHTAIGLGVKARHTAYVISEYWAEPLEKADWDRRAVRLLIEAVCALAGRPLPSNPSEPWLGA
jgi:hypothetical protein